MSCSVGSHLRHSVAWCPSRIFCFPQRQCSNECAYTLCTYLHNKKIAFCYLSAITFIIDLKYINALYLVGLRFHFCSKCPCASYSCCLFQFFIFIIRVYVLFYILSFLFAHRIVFFVTVVVVVVFCFLVFFFSFESVLMVAMATVVAASRFAYEYSTVRRYHIFCRVMFGEVGIFVGTFMWLRRLPVIWRTTKMKYTLDETRTIHYDYRVSMAASVIHNT